jgi:hypothetical protein
MEVRFRQPGLGAMGGLAGGTQSEHERSRHLDKEARMRTTVAARTVVAVMIAMLMSIGTLTAQAYRPVVMMSVTLPNGQSQDLSAPESGLATVTVDGRAYGFRPTMMDDRGARIVIGLFDMGGPTDAVKMLAEIDTSAGGPTVTFKTTPVFKVKVTNISKGSMTT